MNNVIAFSPAAAPVTADSRAALLTAFANNRHAETNVFWLKENAELLGILATSGAELPPGALAPFADFYDGLDEKIRFYPQYYRFLLSICLDLEALGLPGDKGSDLCDWVAKKGFAEAELSDLQRAEARRLLCRRGASDPVGHGALGERLHRFISRSETFAMPNKKAAYELTHIVFYLSEYGFSDPNLPAAAKKSLEFAGVLAYLDQDCDLLAEVCAAMRFADMQPSDIWVRAVQAHHASFDILPAPEGAVADSYHAYFVTGWAAQVMGLKAFETPVPTGPIKFASATAQTSALRILSGCLSDLGPARSGDWTQMRGRVLSCLGQTGHNILLAAEQSTSRFDQFFEGFARAARV